jgi:hypothetical protein
MQKYNGQLIRQFASSVSGNAASGVTVTVRRQSDSGLATLYVDNNIAGATLPNPITSSSTGHFSFYAPDDVYTLTFSDTTPVQVIQLQDVAELQAQFDSAVLNAGYIPSGTFSAGATLTQANQVLSDGSSYWRWDGSLPKTVTAGSAPTPTGAGGWIVLSDFALRGDLATVNSAVLVGGVEAGYLGRKYSEFPTVGDKDITALGFTAALQAALNDAIADGVVLIPPGDWDCGEVILPDKNISVAGVGATINATASRVFVRRKRGYFFGMSDIKFMGNGIAFDYDSNEASLPNHTQYFEYLINNCRFHSGVSAFALRLYGAREGLVSSCYFEGNKGVYTEFSINTVLDSCQWKNCDNMVLSKLGSEGLIVSNAVALGCSFGIRAERTTGVQINNCMIDYCDSPIYLQGATDVLIQNNYISTRTANPAINAVKYPDGFRGYNHLIAGNNIRDNHSVAGSSCIRYEESDFVTITNNTLSNYASYAIVYTLLTQSTISCNTTINRPALGTNSMLALTDDSTVRVYENVVTQPISRAFTQSTWRNQGFTTENFGVATSGVGVTTFAINHGCIFTPANFNIKLTAGSDIPERFWVSATSATTFTVSFSAATAAARTICWEVTSAP